jgi:anti-sigma factor RsiW
MSRHRIADHPCEAFRIWMLEALDGALPSDTARKVAVHLADCEECRRLSADLRQIREAAVKLPRMTPRANAWATIAARLRQEPPAPQPRMFGQAARLLAVAAVLVVAVGTAVLLLRTPAGHGGAPGAGTSAAVNAPAGDLVQTVDEELRQAEGHYGRAIAGLEQIAKDGQSSLDPAVAATLQKNIGIIDQAIGESRNALKSQPGSDLAQESLFEALRRKVALLEDTIALINRMRKGDQAGAARVIKGINKT